VFGKKYAGSWNAGFVVDPADRRVRAAAVTAVADAGMAYRSSVCVPV
jgi:hypothetical protein